MPGRTVLVTGGAGFIGANLVRSLLERFPDDRVISYDALTYAARRENLAECDATGRHELVVGDVCDRAAVEDVVARCDAVLHLAAETHVDRSIRDATPFYRTNVIGTQVVLEAVRAQRPREVPVVLVSTDEVYGSLAIDEAARFTESSPMRPSSAYAASKAGAEHVARAEFVTHGLDVRVTRGSNTLGPFQYPEKVVPLFALLLLEDRSVPIYGDGSNVRDWLHADDHAGAVIAVLERGSAGEVYNVAGGAEMSNIELARALLAVTGRGEELLSHVGDRPGHDQRYSMDCSKIERDLGWKPSRSAWPQALERTVRWYRDNPAWCDAVTGTNFRDYLREQYGGAV